MSRAAFLDRDGVLNRKPDENDYITRWEDLDFLPDTANAIALLNRAGFCVFVVTNQRCVAKGLITAQELENIHSRMCQEYAAEGASIDAVYYCPHQEQPACNCRKPQPGMLLAAAREYKIDLATSWMIGDSDRDVEAGRRAGCKTARICTLPFRASGSADLVASSLLDAVRQMLDQEDMTLAGLEMGTKSTRGGRQDSNSLP